MTEVGRITAILDADGGQLQASLDQVKQQAISTATDIEKDVSSHLSKGFSGTGMSDGIKEALGSGQAAAMSQSEIDKLFPSEAAGGFTGKLNELGESLGLESGKQPDRPPANRSSAASASAVFPGPQTEH